MKKTAYPLFFILTIFLLFEVVKMAPTLAKDQCVEIPQKGGKFELDVSSNSSFCVKLEGNPTTGYSWSLDNENELEKFGIEKISQEYVSKKHSKGMVGVGGNYTFNFNVKDTCGKELPSLQFVYKRSWEKNNGTTASVKLNSIEKCGSNPNDDDVHEPTIEISQEGGNFKLDVNDNSSFNIKIAGNPTTGYSWYLENAEELKSSDVILPTNLNERNGSDDYVSVPHEEGMVGYGGTFIYKFNVKDACGKELPKLNFGYKRPWETTGSIATAEVTLSVHDCEKKKEQEQEQSMDKEIVLSRSATEGVILLSNGMNFSIKLNGNPTTGYSWYLTNEEELLNHGITPLNLTPEKSGEYTSTAPKGLVGGGGIFDFKFKIKEVTNDIPTIKFTYRRSWMPVSESDRILEVEIKPE